MQFELSISRSQNAIYFSIIAMSKKSHFTISAWSILESKGMGAIFQKKGQRNVEKGQNICKFEHKCAKFENILKQGKWLQLIIAHNKLLK